MAKEWVEMMIIGIMVVWVVWVAVIASLVKRFDAIEKKLCRISEIIRSESE